MIKPIMFSILLLFSFCKLYAKNFYLGPITILSYFHDAHLIHTIDPFYNALNFRDLGESLNQCLSSDFFQTKKIFRSNKFFSHWPCSWVGSPDSIYSLNFNYEKSDKYYFCTNDSFYTVGQHFNPPDFFEIHNLYKLLERWTTTAYRQTVCGHLRAIFNDLVNNRSLLIHCSAGTDRTGVISSLITSSLTEIEDLYNSQILDAIECDYERSPKVFKVNYKTGLTKVGRLKNLLEKIRMRYGTTAYFLMSECDLPEELLKNAAKQFILNGY